MADTPVAMSDHAEKRMIVEQYGVGVLFDETDPKAIARAFEQFVTDTIAYPKAVTACRAASQTLNWQHEEYTFRSVYKGFLGERLSDVPPIQIPENECTLCN